MSEIAYYRLRQTDFDGKTTYYETIIISNNKDDLPVFPNPAGMNVILEAEDGSYELLDANGRVVSSGFLDKNSHILDVSHLPEGDYFLRVNNGKTRSLIVRH